MKRWIIATAAALGLGILTFGAVCAYVAVGRAVGQPWTSLGGPETEWPEIVGYAAIYLIIASAFVLVVLTIVAIIMDGRRRRTRDNA